MKPITLKLAGLQSYREMQQIDFDDLTQMGLFGIFGPTGSGKSTLLDAITLSLYGKVERAVNGTQGIMNHSEDSLFVSFTFELNSSEGAQQYRVERRFKRSNELSISNTISRFIEVTPDGDVVIADKLADVTRCVEDKIGLKMDDFTRAVVLPQGKFAEFLSLKGTERRQMLQRLFHLEQYGDQLGQKLSRRVKENEATLRNMEAEQQGLGNAGKEALGEAKKQLSEAVTHAEVSRRRLHEITIQAEQLSKVWEWQIERGRRQEQLLQLSSLENEVKDLEDKLSKASVAQHLMPLLTQMQESKQEYLNRETKAISLHGKAQEAEQGSLRAMETDDVAKLTLSSEEPKLLIRQDQLVQAVKLQQERDTLRSECQDLDAKKANVVRTQSELHEQLLKEKELLNKGQNRQAELQESLKPLETRSQERELIHKAIQRRHIIQSSDEQQQIVSNEYDQQGKRLAEMSSKLSSFERELLNNASNNTLFIERLTSHVSVIIGQEKAVNQDIRRLSAEEAELHEEIKSLETHALSLSLATQLQTGQPCPVCGSEHHPHPVETTDGSEKLTLQTEQMACLREVHLQLQELRLKLHQLMMEGRTLMEQVGVVLPEQDESQTVTEMERSNEVTYFSVAYWRDRIHQMEETSQELIRQTSTLRQENVGMKQSDGMLQQQHMRYMAEVDALRNIHTETKSKLDRVTTELTKLHQAWVEQFPELPLMEIEQKFELMQKKDAEAETLKERIEISIPFIEGKLQAVQSIEQQLGELEKAHIQWNTQWQGKHELLLEKEERLFAFVGERSAESLLEECVQQLKILRATAEQSQKERRTAEDLKHEAIKVAVIAQQAVDSAMEHYKAALSRWEQMLASSILSSAEEVEACCLQREEEMKHADVVRAHRENEREVTLQLAYVEDKLSGIVLTEEEWDICKATLDECRNTDEAAIQFKARAERDLEDVIDRHSRWMQLEDVRVERQTQGEQLSKLQSCLRGNAFVEYIAEEQLMQVSQAASQRLLFLTRQRYALEVDSGGGFVIRDDANGGTRRPVSTLSGGETFLTSLSLALALSAQIQLRGQYPLQFFFLDEGFGTLDPDLLEMVITSLERLHSDHLSVGIISHVPELRARLPRKLVVLPAENAGGGSRLVMENM
ncbi:AAA family ATPase [Paenibacillus sp. FA6]|uniref:AAA family ATPase n=1 Tax=Paenibacillus sp. FA6 TaxID=3413029 RepID=UPI003F659346